MHTQIYVATRQAVRICALTSVNGASRVGTSKLPTRLPPLLPTGMPTRKWAASRDGQVGRQRATGVQLSALTFADAALEGAWTIVRDRPERIRELLLH
ncbi:hypothetical protein ABH935_007794 [Catenulispora sp. GAS73]|uniref:hypothetical protein n=1 Tax=Catenulispora sp. GAS73 TaxID=3156269 RepID=UPI003515C0D4